MTSKKEKEVPFDSKQTEMLGNIQLGDFPTQDLNEIRKIFTQKFNEIYVADSWYFIVHDDSDHLHVHFILLLKGQVRLCTMCNKLAEMFDVNPLAISITRLKSIVGSLKYWLHITPESIEDGKKPYPASEIISTDSDLVIQGYLDSESDNNISLRLIRQLIIESDIKSDVLIKLNNDKLIKKNRYYIDTMWNDKDILQLRQHEIEDLPF